MAIPTGFGSCTSDWYLYAPPLLRKHDRQQDDFWYTSLNSVNVCALHTCLYKSVPNHQCTCRQAEYTDLVLVSTQDKERISDLVWFWIESHDTMHP